MIDTGLYGVSLHFIDYLIAIDNQFDIYLNTVS